ncbi:Fur family transcriptional regulator [Butyrivibrio proteoclasticus]|uniref:Fur family transcriptional regulator n=1 Tax=Butyrivibrio proteoclasticus TaxID=43305 RepID=UPI00047DBFFB|nr:transcriptional repressor [Butyrivibrio proteoclasticus]
MSNEQIIKALKDSGMRITKQRQVVAGVIAENDGASCKDICCMARKRDNSIGIATVYRMIKTLEDLGVIERIDMIRHHR